MINQGDIRLSHINRISGLKLKDTELDSILESHPYFQLGLVEKSRRLRQNNHIDAIKYARKCAILFPNRSILYQLIHNSDSDLTKELIVSDEENLIADAPEKIIENRELNIDESEKETSSIESRDSEKEGFKDATLEKEYLAEAINQSIQMESGSYLIEEEFPLEEKEESEIIRIASPENTEILSFTEWINGDDYEIESKSSFKAELIDRFIQESPQISKIQDKDFYSPVEKGKASLSENDLLYSETLASIFVNQGNKDLAIKAYQHLMLKNPQKSVYFADLIKKLEE